MSQFTSRYQDTEELQKLQLGKSTAYISEYTPNLLQGVARSLNRDELQLDDTKLPFIGEDVWYGYEISWLNLKGKPMVAVGEFRFPYHSKALVESKSFKLYLNSFNQSRFKSIDEVKAHMVSDLSKVAGAKAQVRLFPVSECPALELLVLPATCIDDLDIEISDYHFDAALLHNKDQTSRQQSVISETLVSHLLKSNCLITNQPDWASVYISYKGQGIDHESLLRYLISFRQHNEFHEQCVERIFTDLLKTFQLTELTVFARYTRRGGLDINPFRSTHLKQAPFARTIRQ
ncbi:MAG: NADPH-dependent 7-cyano-7-deazaguanine reductase QueF [Thalassotalea sp.]